MLLEQGFLTGITRNHTGIEKHPETLVPFYINYLQDFHKPNLSYLSCILNYIVFWKHKLPEDRQPLTRTTRYRLLLSYIEEAESSKKGETSKKLQMSLDGYNSSNQIKEFIKDSIKDQVESRNQSSIAYAKSHTQRIDLMRMSTNYKPLKFQQFDGKGNPRQDVAYFIETCNNADTYGDLMVKQFVRSTKGNVFDWHTDLKLKHSTYC